MISFALILMTAGFLGLLGATFGGSVIAALFGQRTKRESDILALGETLKLEILVAAHNEESVILETLASLTGAADRLQAVAGDRFELRITVGLDHCTDRSAELVEAFARTSTWSVRSIENPLQGSKWNNLRTLISQAQGDWVALVDSGSVWEADLLVAAWSHLLDGSVVGVSPSYSPKGAGALERFNWKLERSLKELENRAGGPISVHGATVLYRLEPLREVMKGLLAGNHWFNDDVAIPMSLRIARPEGRLVYLAETPASGAAGWVRDVGVVSDVKVEYRRRRRMAAGNVQWIQSLLIPHLFSSPAVAFLASRRVFRLFWAYSVLFIGLGFAMLVPFGAIFAMAAAAALYVRSNWVRRLATAFVSGLLVPRFWFQNNGVRGVSWV